MANLGKILKTNSMKTCPVADSSFMPTQKLKGEQTDITILIIRFHVFVKAPKNV